jgi:hypothetical protein
MLDEGHPWPALPLQLFATAQRRSGGTVSASSPGMMTHSTLQIVLTRHNLVSRDSPESLFRQFGPDSHA